MISGVNSMSSSMAMMQSSSAQRQGPPPSSGETVFDVADTNKDGVVSSDELAVLSAGIEESTGSSLDVDEALATFDADGNGGLSGEELQGLMTSQGFAPPMMVENESGDMQEMQPPPPPPPSNETVQSAYGQNSGDDMISQLLEILQGDAGSDEDYTSLALTG